jgi:hypothetical protein
MKIVASCRFAFLIAIHLLLLPFAVAENEPSVRLAEGLSISDTLRIVAQHQSSDPAQVRVVLKSGVIFEGSIAGYDERKAVCHLIQHDGSTSLINVFDVSSITVLDAGSAKVALQGNKIYREASTSVPTNLVFKRYLAELAAKSPVSIRTAFSEADIQSADCRYYAHELLKALETSVSQVVADQSGRDAIKQHGNSIAVLHRAKAELTISASPAGVTLQFDCLAPLAGNYQEQITSELNSVL